MSKEGKISLLLTNCVCLPTKIRATEKVLSLVSTCNGVCVLEGAYYYLLLTNIKLFNNDYLFIYELFIIADTSSLKQDGRVEVVWKDTHSRHGTCRAATWEFVCLFFFFLN